MKYAVVLHHDEDSAYGVSVPDLPWCFSDGDSFDEALENVVEGIDLTQYLGKTEKINLTLPSAVIRKIDAEHKNGSSFLV